MKLRTKSSITVVITLAVLVVGLYLAMAQSLRAEFQKAQAQSVRSNIERAITAYRSQASNLDSLVRDWAYWDATYQFIRQRNQGYVQSNLNTASIASLHVNVMLYLLPSGAKVYGTGFNSATGQQTGLPPGLLTQMRPGSRLMRFSSLTANNSGLIDVGKGRLMLVDTAQILTSTASGPSRGVLLFGRYVNQPMVQTFQKLTALPVAVTSYPPRGPEPAWFVHVPSGLLNGRRYSSQAISHTAMVGVTILPSVYNKPAAVVEVKMHRTVHEEESAALRFLVIALGIAGLVFVGLMLGMLDRLVLGRLTRLHEEVQAIRSREDLGRRMYVSGSDELSGLASAINRMLADLQGTTEREQRLRAEVQELRIEIDQTKRKREVDRIVESDYFQSLKEKAEAMKISRLTEPGEA